MLRLTRRLTTAGTALVVSAIPVLGVMSPTPAQAIPNPCHLVLDLLGIGALCDALPSGPNFSTAAPNTALNTTASVPVVVTDPLAALYSATSTAVDVTLTGPAGNTNVINGTSTSVTSSTVLTTFDLTSSSTGLDADPGAYEITITPHAISASLGTVLTALGIGALPVDTAAFTVTAGTPTPAASVGVSPGGSTPAAITTATTPFTAGDTVSFTDNADAAVAGLTLSTPVISATSITGTVNADVAVPGGTYNLLVTDTAGQVGKCTGCVTVAVGPNAVTSLAAKATTGTTAALSWVAPATGPTVTSYSFVITKTQANAQSDAGVSVSQATPTTAAATVTGLTAGTKYYVKVIPKHDTLVGTAASTTMVTPYATKLTLSGSPAKPTGGQTVTLSGQLTKKVGATSQPLVGKSVGVYAKFVGATKYVLVGAVMTTKADGTYAETYAPTRAGAYTAIFLGEPAVGDTPGTSLAFSDPAISETPQPVVTLTATGKAHGSKFTMHVKGTVSPNEAGKNVVVTRTVHGTATKFGHAHLDANGKYSFTKNKLGPGVYKLQAKIKSHFGNASATSSNFTIKAT